MARIACGSVIKRVAMLPVSLTQLVSQIGRCLWMSTGRRRMRYHASGPRHLEAGLGFALSIRPFVAFGSRRGVPAVRHIVIGIGTLFRFRCPMVVVVRRNGHAPTHRN